MRTRNRKVGEVGMTGKELIEWIKDNKAEELVVIVAINDYYACDRKPEIRETSDVKEVYFLSSFESGDKVIFF